MIDFYPTKEAGEVFHEIQKRFPWMEGFRDGPFGKNELTETESALYGAIYAIRKLEGIVQDSGDASEQLGHIYKLLTDGVLRSMVMARGGVDWVEREG